MREKHLSGDGEIGSIQHCCVGLGHALGKLFTLGIPSCGADDQQTLGAERQFNMLGHSVRLREVDKYLSLVGKCTAFLLRGVVADNADQSVSARLCHTLYRLSHLTVSD